jgi:hypothetical protein
MDFNLVAWFKVQRFDDDGGKAERKTVSHLATFMQFLRVMQNESISDDFKVNNQPKPEPTIAISIINDSRWAVM